MMRGIVLGTAAFVLVVVACTSSTSSTPAGSGACSEQISCAVGEGTTTVDRFTDVIHCGVCNNTCGAGQVCDRGTCASACSGGRVQCAGTCFDPTCDPRSCGACGVQCPTGHACQSGECVSKCAPNEAECDGACVDVKSNALRCGSCHSACRKGTCVDGKCLCPDGQKLCIENMQLTGMTCTVVDGSDPRNCGDCNTYCSDAQVCVSGQCVAK